MLNTLDGKGYDQWATRRPREPREIVLELDKCPADVLRRACKEELDEITEEQLRNIGNILYFCGMETVTLTEDEAAEWEKGQASADIDRQLAERKER